DPVSLLRILVTGANGMLGHDVVRAARFVNHEVVPLGREDVDVVDGPAVERAVMTERPNVVVNCAAYTRVDDAQDDLDGAMAVNADGARHVAAAAAAIGAGVIYPSTDYVFDGSKSSPYVESDELRPLSVYAQSKAAGEHETAASNPRHWIVRTSWLFGIGGRNFVETMLGLGRELDEVLVVRDQIGCPTYAGHFADALVQLVEDDADYGLRHIAGGGQCSWYEFAEEIFKQANVDTRVLSCTTAEMPRPAPRPSYSVLGTEREDAIYLPDWREGLASYLADRAAVSQ
ncbi:MAG: dTDP-4-dehydrorhamnose reductase, partial [Thermoleophilaceae bacterium]